MENITYFVSELDATDWVQIKNADGGFTSMPKAVYDAQVEHLTEIPTPDEA